MQSRPASAEIPLLGELYDQELPHVYGFLVRLGARGADLEDLGHDVFATAIRRWPTFDVRRPVRPWLLGIAFRVALDFKRRARPTAPAHEAPEPVADAEAERHLDRRETRDLITEALQSLPEERRAAVVMYELEGLSVAEIAAAFEVPQATIYSRLRIGRDELAAAVRRIRATRGEA